MNGSIASSPVFVDFGGTLGGNGTVGPTTILAGGALSPGNSVGTLTVNGNLVFAAASLYMVEVQGNTADRANASGAATLAGTVARLAPRRQAGAQLHDPVGGRRTDRHVQLARRR